MKRGTKLLMKEEPSYCRCDTCKKFAGRKVTFKEWDGKIGGHDNFLFEESTEERETLFFVNVEKVLGIVPEELFEI